MQVYLRGYFWTINVLVVALCAAFMARCVGHYLEAEYLPESAEPAKPKARVMPRPKRKQPVRRSKAGEPFAKRNMFCSTCEPPEPEEKDDGGEVIDSDRPPITSLPLQLLATHVAMQELMSLASVKNRDTNNVGGYRVGERIPEAGPIVRIRGKYIDFENKDRKRVERLMLTGEDKGRMRARTTPRPTPERTRPRSRRAELSAEMDEGIKKVDDTHYEIDRGLLEKIIANPTLIRGARIVPAIKNGKANGFKLYAVRPSSAFAKIGLHNGDNVQAINGFDLSSPDKMLEVYTKVREASNIEVSLVRRGKPVTMQYSVR